MQDQFIKQLIEEFVRDVRQKVPDAAESIWDAFRAVPRHLFIDQYYELKDNRFTRVDLDKSNFPEAFLKLVYSDNGIIIHEPLPRTHSAASQPSLVAAMLHHLELAPGLKVLEIGTGSGWSAALMASIVGTQGLVASIDLQPDLIEQAGRHLLSTDLARVNLLAADGAYGWAEHGPFDRIVATVGCPDIPPAWLDQLNDGGQLLVPLKTAPVGDPLLRLRKQADIISGNLVGPSWFMTLQGAFCTDSEDTLSPPWDPQVTALLSSPPTTSVLPCQLDMDLLLFAHLSGMHLRTLVDWTKRHGPAFAIFDSEYGTITVPDHKDAAISIYGDKAQVARWVDLLEQWSAVGKPKATDYRVELSREGSSRHRPSWKMQRQANVYEFSLP